jgi:hypothetical protein
MCSLNQLCRTNPGTTAAYPERRTFIVHIAFTSHIPPFGDCIITVDCRN